MKIEAIEVELSIRCLVGPFDPLDKGIHSTLHRKETTLSVPEK